MGQWVDVSGWQWDKIGTVASAIIAAATLLGVWLQQRESSLRRGDVLRWANDGIEALEELLLVIKYESRWSHTEANSKINNVLHQTSVTIERGRLFFKNTNSRAFGKDKHTAYRGYRPKILDSLVIAHQISLRWPLANEQIKVKLAILAEDSLHQFVSLAQKEVGRSRVGSPEAGKGGDGIRLDDLLSKIEPENG